MDQMELVKEIGFIGVWIFVFGFFFWSPFLFVRLVRRERYYWLPIFYGAFNGALSVALFYAAIASLVGGPVYFLIAMIIIARLRAIPYQSLVFALIIEVAVMATTFFGISFFLFRILKWSL